MKPFSIDDELKLQRQQTKKRPFEETVSVPAQQPPALPVPLPPTAFVDQEEEVILDFTALPSKLLATPPTPIISNENSTDPDADFDDKISPAAVKKPAARKRQKKQPAEQKAPPQEEPEKQSIAEIDEQKEQPEEDTEDEVRLYMYRSGALAKIKSRIMITVFRTAFAKNGITWINTLTNLPNSVGTVYCVFDDKKKEMAMKELTQDVELLKICMQGRLRMTPLSNLLGVLEQSDYTSFDLAVLRMCSYMCRPKIEKFVSYIDVWPRVSPNWRIPGNSIHIPPNAVVINNKQKFESYLLDQMFPHRSEEKN